MKDYQESQRSEQDISELLELWLFLDGAAIQPTHKGTVNKTYQVETQTGKFILKLYNDSISTAQIQYEHSLLTYLEALNLSFAVPTPIPASSGETLVMASQNESSLRVALLPFISGEPADRTNLFHTHAVGQALGELHCALDRFDSKAQMAQLSGWGNLDRIHPLVPDPLEVPRLLELPLSQQQRVIKTFSEVLEAAPNLYATLPVQTIHADFLCPNVLLRDNRVVGVLDFEFATFDLRLIDYLIALDHFTRLPWQEAPCWEFVKAFSSGYDKYVSLSPLEIEALTLVWRLQQASCIIYWTGWLIEGKATHQSVLDGVARMLLLEDWFEENAIALLSHLA